MTVISKVLKHIQRDTLLSAASIIFTIALWEICVDLKWVNSAFFIAPSTILAATIDLILNGELLNHIAITLARMLTGFFIGTILGLAIGMVMGWSKHFKALLEPFVSIIYPLPKIALLPLLILLIGVGEKPIILVIAMGAFFPVLVNCIAGVVTIDRIYFDVAKNYGASQFKIFIKIILPGILPLVLAGIRLALGMSLLLAVVLELSIATKGIGAMLWLSWETLRIERIYVAIFVIAVIGLLLNPLLQSIGRRLAPWREEW